MHRSRPVHLDRGDRRPRRRPLADQGEHSRANAQTLCLSCNSSKQAGIAQKV
ncbi:HNH endonuclease [Nocardioides sp. ChNu-153]|uniref:HNH endonuclease n=1 Tax=Nocardioides sp. ChNu-153 TaxID=2779364 RepID=UPI00346270A7